MVGTKVDPLIRGPTADEGAQQSGNSQSVSPLGRGFETRSKQAWESFVPPFAGFHCHRRHTFRLRLAYPLLQFIGKLS